MNAITAAQIVKQLVIEQGFERVGIAEAERVNRADFAKAWLRNGYAGRMDYLHRHLDQRLDLRELLPGARSVIVAALNYHQRMPQVPDDRGAASELPCADGCSTGPPLQANVVPPREASPSEVAARGRVAMYAWGEDYHDVVKHKLGAVVDAMRATIDGEFATKVCVDTAPILEREWAAAAGVGWIGKNTLAMHQSLGSYFFLGEIVTTLDLAPDDPATDHCGTCTRCLDACPTQAFPQPYVMDASKCISYLTIELREDIPEPLQPLMSNWIFGCDICQEVCPHNRRSPETNEPRFAIRPPAPTLDLTDLLTWDDQSYRAKTRNSALRRAKLHMLQRNARITLNNSETAQRHKTC